MRNSRPDPLQGLRLVQQAIAESPGMIRAGGMEVALLRRTGQAEEARARLAHWRTVDPPSSFLRHEAVLLGAADEALWAHLASDPERVLELAVDYMALGLWDDAHALLARRFPSTGVVAEPGTALPQDYPLVAYYRGYCAERAGRSGAGGLRPRLGPVHPLRLPEPSRVSRRPPAGDGGEPGRRHRPLPPRVAPSLRRTGRRGSRRVGEGARARPEAPRPPPQHRLHPPLRAGRRPGGPARLRGGDEPRTPRTSSSTREPTRR